MKINKKNLIFTVILILYKTAFGQDFRHIRKIRVQSIDQNNVVKYSDITDRETVDILMRNSSVLKNQVEGTQSQAPVIGNGVRAHILKLLSAMLKRSFNKDEIDIAFEYIPNKEEVLCDIYRASDFLGFEKSHKEKIAEFIPFNPSIFEYFITNYPESLAHLLEDLPSSSKSISKEQPVEATQEIQGSFASQSIKISPQNNYIFSVDLQNNHLVFINSTDGKIDKEISGNFKDQKIAISPDQKHVISIDQNKNNNIVVINIETGNIEAIIPGNYLNQNLTYTANSKFILSVDLNNNNKITFIETTKYSQINHTIDHDFKDQKIRAADNDTDSGISYIILKDTSSHMHIITCHQASDQIHLYDCYNRPCAIDQIIKLKLDYPYVYTLDSTNEVIVTNLHNGTDRKYKLPSIHREDYLTNQNNSTLQIDKIFSAKHLDNPNLVLFSYSSLNQTTLGLRNGNSNICIANFEKFMFPQFLDNLVANLYLCEPINKIIFSGLLNNKAIIESSEYLVITEELVSNDIIRSKKLQKHAGLKVSRIRGKFKLLQALDNGLALALNENQEIVVIDYERSNIINTINGKFNKKSVKVDPLNRFIVAVNDQKLTFIKNASFPLQISSLFNKIQKEQIDILIDQLKTDTQAFNNVFGIKTTQNLLEKLEALNKGGTSDQNVKAKVKKIVTSSGEITNQPKIQTLIQLSGILKTELINFQEDVIITIRDISSEVLELIYNLSQNNALLDTLTQEQVEQLFYASKYLQIDSLLQILSHHISENQDLFNYFLLNCTDLMDVFAQKLTEFNSSLPQRQLELSQYDNFQNKSNELKVLFGKNGKIYHVGKTNREIEIRERNKQIKVINGNFFCEKFAINSNKNIIAYIDNELYVYDIERDRTNKFPGDFRMQNIAISPDGNYVSSINVNTRELCVFNLTDSKDIITIAGNFTGQKITFSNDSNFVISYNESDKTICILDIKSRKYRRINSVNISRQNLLLSKDNNFLISTDADSKKLLILDLKANHVNVVDGNFSTQSLAFSPDCNSIAAFENNSKSLYIIKTATGEFNILRNNQDFTNKTIQFTPDGRFMVVSDVNNALTIIDTTNNMNIDFNGYRFACKDDLFISPTGQIVFKDINSNRIMHLTLGNPRKTDINLHENKLVDMDSNKKRKMIQQLQENESKLTNALGLQNFTRLMQVLRTNKAIATSQDSRESKRIKN